MKIRLFGKEFNINRTFILSVILPISVIAIFIALFIGYFFSKSGNSIIIEKKSGSSIQSSSIDNGKSTESQAVIEDKAVKIKVYVVGSVKKPGVVELDKGQIIEDAINAAGGAKTDADLENINLAYILNENTMIKILSKKESTSKNSNTTRPISSIRNDNQAEAGTGIKISKDSGGAVVNEKSVVTGTDGKININTASSSELDTLAGVGQATAKKIIDYREKNGPFKTIDDIKNVSGIGDSKFNNFKDMITVE